MGSDDDTVVGDASRDDRQAASEQDVELMGVQTNVTGREDVPPDGGRSFITSHFNY